MRHLLAERRATVARRIDAEQAQLAAIEARIRHSEDAQPTCDIVLREVPAVIGREFGASGGARTMAPSTRCSTRSARTPPATARIAGHGAVWHHCAPHKRQNRLPGSDGASGAADLRAAQPGLTSCRPAARPASSIPADDGSLRPRPVPPPGQPSPTSHSCSKEVSMRERATTRAPAIRASTSPRSSFRFVRPQEPSARLSPSPAPRLMPPPTGYSQIAEVTKAQDRADRGPGRATTRRGSLVGEERFRRPGRAGVQEIPDAAVRAAGGTLHDIVKINNYCDWPRSIRRSSRPSARCATAMSTPPRRPSAPSSSLSRLVQCRAGCSKSTHMAVIGG